MVAMFWPFAAANASETITLKVVSLHGLLGVHHSALARFLTERMAGVGLKEWRFEPAEADIAASDRVEWTFRLNPYAGGEIRHFSPTSAYQSQVGGHRPITIETRLYLHGEYQALVEKQAVVQGGPNDPDLAAAVASVTQKLLGPSGAYRAIDAGQGPAHPEK
jgi:hypothetical protein